MARRDHVRLMEDPHMRPLRARLLPPGATLGMDGVGGESAEVVLSTNESHQRFSNLIGVQRRKESFWGGETRGIREKKRYGTDQ